LKKVVECVTPTIAGHQARERTMTDDIVVLNGTPTKVTSAAGREFISDCVRAGEGLIGDNDLCNKYEITAADWENITQNGTLLRAVKAEGQRRIRTGIAAQESAAKLFAKAPTVLGDILNDNSASPRHRIESARELRVTSTGTAHAENTADAEKFVITINLGADHIEHFEKTIAPMKPLLPVIKDKVDDDE
jgi:hypothetical protein